MSFHTSPKNLAIYKPQQNTINRLSEHFHTGPKNLAIYHSKQNYKLSYKQKQSYNNKQKQNYKNKNKTKTVTINNATVSNG